MKYYIHKAGSQQGPYSIEALQNLKIDRTTMIWCEGMEDWTAAQNITELEELFKSPPPPFKTSTPPPFKKATNRLPLLVIITAVIIFLIIIFFIISRVLFSSNKEILKDTSDNNQNPIVLTDALKEKETQLDSTILAADLLEEKWREREHFEQLYESFHGEYYSISYGYGTSAEIEYLGNNQLKFNLTISSKKDCSGIVSGTLDIIDEEVMVYKEGACELFFEFKEEQLIIRERDCDLHHGMNCNFSATMRKYSAAEFKRKIKYFSNIEAYLNPHTNSYKKNLIMGGIWDLSIKVDNQSPYKMDAVHVKVEYLRADKSVYQQKEVILYNIKPGERKRIGAPNSEKGVEVRCTVSYVESRSLYS